MGLSLVAFDTDHIKSYVFATDKLKEIRGASSLLDFLNRVEMTRIAQKYNARMTVYAHGGSGLYLVPTASAEAFGKHVQRKYYDITGGGASVAFVQLPVPENIVNSGEDITHVEMPLLFELLQWHIQEKKQQSSALISRPSHSFMRSCDACGVEYVDAREPYHGIAQDSDDEPDDGEENERYCEICLAKRIRDVQVKKFIRYFVRDIEAKKETTLDDYLWRKIILRLSEMQYNIPPKTRRPRDFNIFRNFKGFKDYFALIYADANNMGRMIEQYNTLDSRKMFAHTIDDAIYESVCTAIARHLKIDDHLKSREERSSELKHPVFPFDVLLMGGDDICMVVPASVALDVALTLSEIFYRETQNMHTLSVGVVLAPVKYPFGLLQEMAETTLKFAKKAGSDARARSDSTSNDENDTRINFMIVTGSTKSNFKHVYNDTYHKKDDETHQDFYATLRPYAPKDLQHLLDTIRGKDGANLGRTKLHQVREAVLKMNLTTSVSDGLSVLHNWREKQRNHVVHNVYEFAARYQIPHSNPDDPVSGFPRVIFPWFKDGTKTYKKGQYDVYRTSLLDFIELYDFLSRDGGDNAEEK